ncbi:thiopeptide maturation pyridine synthase [Saccharopolyspora pogona]|uniref:thiopeptide maturation pyridine synthase n=1 Tax=Saccharopolyspora pogona TaxID=333966 RepID=UPI001688EE53|nr:thiopeptide maturation pyridine synthase [Saccharopolyspora pogona]
MSEHVGTAEWHGVQVYFYEENKDDLILNCVRPLFGRLAPFAERMFYTRHWLRGPHLRLSYLASEGDFTNVIHPETERTVARYLTENPSTAEIDEEELLAVHRAVAEQEQQPGPFVPFHPDNSVQLAPYDRRIPVLGSAVAAELLEGFYHETNAQAFAALDDVRSGRSRLTTAFDLMVATAHAMWPGINRGFISFRSHAEGFIARAGDPQRRRAFCEEKYRAQKAGLRRRLVAVLDGLDGLDGDGEVPLVREWVAVLGRYRSRVRPLIASGEVSFVAAEQGYAQQSWDPQMLAHSTFHSLLQGEGGRMARLQRDPDFLAFRFALNYLYLHLNRIGVRPVERFVLCHLVANTVEDHYGISAHDFVAS